MFLSKKFELNLLVTAIMLFVLRMAVPFMIYLFSPYFILFSAYFILKYWKVKDKMANLIIISKVYFPFLIIAGILILAYLFSSVQPMLISKDILHIAVALTFIIVLLQEINSTSDFNQFGWYFNIQIIVLSAIVSILGLSKFVLQLQRFGVTNISSLGYTAGTSLTSDYNFYILFSILGLLALIINRLKLNKTLFILIFIILNCNILFSNSRRGIIILFAVWLALFLFGLNFKVKLKSIAKRIMILFIILFVVCYSLTVIHSHIVIKQKNQSVDLNSKFKNNLQSLVSTIISRYLTVINVYKSEEEIYDELWVKHTFYRKLDYNEYDRLKEENNLFYNGSFYYNLLFWIPDANATRHEIIKTPFGNGIRVSRANGDGGYWSLRYGGRPIIYYANHTYKIKFNLKIEKGNNLPFNIGWWVNDANQGFIAHVLPLTVKKIQDGWSEVTCAYKFKETHFDLPTFLNSLQDSSIVDIANIELTDLDRDNSLPLYLDQIAVKKNITESSNKAGFNYQTYDNKLYSPRTNRWKYSWVVFNDSLTTTQKLIGGGFDYFEMFGKKFDKGDYDWPHNPIISTFLYSGIIGGLIFIWFLILVFINYLLYLKRHLVFFVSFMITFFFVFFSDFSLFNTPIFTILCIIPFFTKYLCLKEECGKDNKIPLKRILFW